MDKYLLEDLNEAAARVTAALNELIGLVKQGPEVTQAPIPHEAAVEVITISTAHLCAAPEPAEMIRQAKVMTHLHRFSARPMVRLFFPGLKLVYSRFWLKQLPSWLRD